jgi:hypothetical protein
MDELICYCFEYTKADIEKDYVSNGRSLIMERITNEKKFGNCQCAVKNPKGKWCLFDVRQVVDRVKGKISWNIISWNYGDQRIFKMSNGNQASKIITIKNSLAPLKDRFNTNNGEIRFLALLSPTCPLWRDQGARAVYENVFKKYPNADISGYIVWINMLPEDSIEAARPTIKVLDDGRIQHFYDPNQKTGKEIAISVGWAGNTAWDIYLFYRPFVEWAETPPKPIYWMHQLTDSWATKDKYRTGGDLKNELSIAMGELVKWML